MFKKLCLLMIISVFVFGGTSVYAEKGASVAGLEHASDEAVFNRVSDWFATVGKSPEEKQVVLAKRKAARIAKKAEKRAKAKTKEAEKGMKEAKKDMKSGLNSLSK